MPLFLAVPLKTSAEVDIAKAITKFVESYASQDEHKAEGVEAANELNELRKRACSSPLDKSHTGLEILTRYYDQMSAIENKIPISATQNPVVFKWNDAFDKGRLFSSGASLSLTDASYERACVLFNIGALQTQVAAAQTFQTDEEAKTAAKLYQQAAGVFAYLRDSVLSLVRQDPTADLQPDTLSALTALCIAQAQEAIYTKAARDKMNPAVVLKIAAQCAELYSDARKAMQRDTTKGVFDKDWHSIVAGKHQLMLAIAQYYGAQQELAAKEFGKALARLEEAQRLATAALKFLPPKLFDTEVELINKLTASTKKDNDFIYHERVADLKHLKELERAVVAKPTALTHPLSPRFKDLFAWLVPGEVRTALAAHDARKADMVAVEVARLREHTNLLNAVLNSLNLPAALDDATSGTQLPDSIRTKSARVKANGGVAGLLESINLLPQLYKRNQDIIDETARQLKEEADSDDQLRRQFGASWSRMSSGQLTQPLVQDIGKYRGILMTASNADAIVRKKLEDHRNAIELLSKTEGELTSALPSAGAAVNANDPALQKLRALMTQVKDLTTKREKLEKDVKDVTTFDMSADFLRALSESGALEKNGETISQERLNGAFSAVQRSVSETVQEQEKLVAQIQENHTAFAARRGGGGAKAHEREEMLKQLAAGHDIFLELRSNLEEGTKFYNDLTPILLKQQQRVSDFCFARQTEKEDLMRQLQINIVQGGGNAGGGSSGGAAPPPRPPPPRPQAPPTQQASSDDTPIPPPRHVNALGAAPPGVQALAPQQGLPAYPQQPNPYGAPQPNPYGVPQPNFYGAPQPNPYGAPQPPAGYGAPPYTPSVVTPYPTFTGAYTGAWQPVYNQFPQASTNPFAPQPPQAQ